MTESVLEARSVTKRFKEKTVLDQLDFTLPQLTVTFMSGKLELNLPTIIGLSVGTAVLGIIVTRQAMKRWCRMDLP